MKVGNIQKRLSLAAAALAAIALWGCGGGGGSKAVTVTVSPKAAQVPLGGTQQFVARVTNGNVQVATIASNGAARSTNIVTITTTMAHGLSAGQTVVIAGVADSSFNGTFTISTVPSTTTFTYVQTGTNATSGGGTVSAGTVKWFVNNVEGGNAASGTISTLGLYTAPSTSLPPATTVNIASNGAVRSNNVVTITTTAAHNLAIGQVVTISGVTDASFNGTFTIASVPSSTTFTFSQAGSNASSGNGTVTTTAVQIKAEAVADNTKSDTALLSVRSGVVVTIAPPSATIGVTQVFPFTATVQNDPNNSGVTWTVQGGTNGSNGTIDSTGLYTAPGTVPSPATVTIQAASVLDSSQTATASVTIVTTSGAAPTLASINPTRGALGSLFQDIYLNGTDLLSTTIVSFNGQQVPPSNIFLVNQSLMRVRVPDTFLAIPGGAVTVPITVQLGFVPSPPPPSPPVNFTIVPVRPAVVESIPDSELQNSVATPIGVNGGYYGSATSPIVTAEFNGNPRSVPLPPPSSVIFNARQLTVQLNSTDLNMPGLYSVGVRNSNASPQVAVTNFAVQPDSGGSNPPVFVTKLGTLGTTLAPGAVAIDTAMDPARAVFANTGGNTVQLIDLTLPTPVLVPGGTIAVGNAPTGIAVDNQRHIALVVNSADQSISIVDLVAKAVTTTIPLGGFVQTGIKPFSVGVNPNTGLALVAYSSTNSGSLLALAGTTSTLACVPIATNPVTPPCVVGSVTLNTGASPQIAVEPRFNVAITTPGGAGVLSLVDLNRQNPISIASAKRVFNVVTITTASAHNIDPANPGSVLISGVTPTGATSFNGTFSVTSVPNSTTFTYSQAAADDTGSGGTVQYANPLVTFSISPSVQGISINTQTERALLADPNSSSLTILSTLDQTSQSVFLTASNNSAEFGARFTAFNPFTNEGVSVNPITNALSIIDPVKRQRLATISTGGTGSGPVAIDPGTNLAVVANTTSNDVSVISLGTLKPVHVEQIFIPLRQLAAAATLTSGTDLPIKIFGKGFSGSPTVRLDGIAVSTVPTLVTDREIDITIPASFLSAPRRYALDVVNGGIQSNASDFTVVEAVDVTSAGSGCTTPHPAAVAIALGIDASHPDLAVVADSGCNAVSLIDITPGNPFGTFGTVTHTIALSGTAPEGVATISRLGHAVVSNSVSNNASIVDLVGGTELSTVPTGTQPLGVAINQDTGFAVVTNAVSNTISVFDANLGGTVGSAATAQRPIAVAIDPNRNIALVANALQGTLQVFTLSTTNSATFSKNIIIGSSVIPPLPTSVVFDPSSTLFLAASPLSDAFLLINTDQGTAQSVRVGINPTSLAYNYLASTLVTVNTENNTLSTVDVQVPGTVHTTAIQGLGNTAQCPVDSNTGVTLCGVDIHPLTNLVVVTDPANNRVLLFPPAK
jgi:DNA-binding beta-propeller fold protein YncE